MSQYIAMNRFKVKKGSEEAFENVWSSRESYLDRMPGFVEFHLLRGPTLEDHTLFSSHTVWRSHADFEAWTKSEAFRNESGCLLAVAEIRIATKQESLRQSVK